MDAKLWIGIGLIALYLILKAMKNKKEDDKKKDPYKSIYGDEDVNVDELIDDEEEEEEEKEAEDGEEEEEDQPAETEDGNPFLPDGIAAKWPERITKMIFGWKKDYQYIVDSNEMFCHLGETNKIETYFVTEDSDNITYYILSDYEIFVPKNGIIFESFVDLSAIEFQNFNTKYVTDMVSMFENCEKLEKLDLSSFDTSNVEDMSDMFSECKSLKEVNLKGFNTSKVIYFSGLFSGCRSLESIDLSGFDTGKGEMFAYMFEECSSLRTLDLSSFCTSNSFNMADMFNDCENLETIYVSDNFVAKANEEKDMEDPMFGNCPKLCATDIDGNKFRYCEDKVNYHYAKILDKDNGVEGYFTRK